MASCIGIDVYKDTTSRLHGYGRVLLVVKSPAWMYLISSSLFSRLFSRIFYSRNYLAYLIYTRSLDHTSSFYSYSYLLIYLRHFTPTFSRFSHIFTLHLYISPTRNIFSYP